jgi:hypothetical protein
MAAATCLGSPHVDTTSTPPASGQGFLDLTVYTPVPMRRSRRSGAGPPEVRVQHPGV